MCAAALSGRPGQGVVAVISLSSPEVRVV